LTANTGNERPKVRSIGKLDGDHTEDNVSEKLMPCPWCGGEMDAVAVIEGSTFRLRMVSGCCTDGPEVRHDTFAEDQAAAETQSRAAAIAAWNTRAPIPKVEHAPQMCRECGQETMHMGDLCFLCGKAATSASNA